MNTHTQVVLSFPGSANPAKRHTLRKELAEALRLSEFPVVLDLSHRRTLNHDDIDLLLECVAQSAGRNPQIFLAAGSRSMHMLLEVIRISSLVPVFDSIEEAVAEPQLAPGAAPMETFSTEHAQRRSAA